MYQQSISPFAVIIFVLLNSRLCASCSPEVGCEVIETMLSCAHEFNVSALLFKHKHIETVEICNLKTASGSFSLSAVFENFPDVTNITITKSDIKRIKGHIPYNNNIKVIRFTNLSLTEIDGDFLKYAKHLEILDLRNNSLKHLHTHRKSYLRNISTIYLSGNKWNCSSHLSWVYQLNESSVRDLSSLKCFRMPYPEIPLIKIAQFRHDMHSTCPLVCNCSLTYVVPLLDTETLEPMIEVNCSGRELSEFPSSLPKYTKKLRLEKNLIDDLTPLVMNPIYKGVQDLYLDQNRVDSIDILEGSYWLSNFRVLSLHGNKLTELPTYAIDNALEHNSNMPEGVMIYLGSNPWRCDCVFTPGFQDHILVKYQPIIQDLNDIKCSYVQGDENSMLPIIQLSRSSVCRLPNEYSVRALDLLNGVLATLIVLILGKLAYDYYYFKKTGRLPWIVTKMP